MGALLSTRQLTKTFGGLTAVDHVDLEIPSRAILSIIGPNGAGKTTLFNIIAGLYTPTSGEIWFDGQMVAGPGPRFGLPDWGGRRAVGGGTGFGQVMRNQSPHQMARLGVARTFQNIRLFQNMTALENVLIGMHTRLQASALGSVLKTPKVTREEWEARQRALDMLDLVGLRKHQSDLAKNLSYGDQRRLEIARALASEPKLLLLDEPTAGMNPQETRHLTQFIRRLRDDRGLTILLIEHDMKVVMGISDTVAVLDHGLKIAEGVPLEIQRNPCVIEAYLGRGAPSAAPAGDESRGGDAGN